MDGLVIIWPKMPQQIFIIFLFLLLLLVRLGCWFYRNCRFHRWWFHWWRWLLFGFVTGRHLWVRSGGRSPTIKIFKIFKKSPTFTTSNTSTFLKGIISNSTLPTNPTPHRKPAPLLHSPHFHLQLPPFPPRPAPPALLQPPWRPSSAAWP